MGGVNCPAKMEVIEIDGDVYRTPVKGSRVTGCLLQYERESHLIAQHLRSPDYICTTKIVGCPGVKKCLLVASSKSLSQWWLGM